MTDKCSICGEETDVIFTDVNENIYCEDCWIEYESKELNYDSARID